MLNAFHPNIDPNIDPNTDLNGVYCIFISKNPWIKARLTN